LKFSTVTFRQAKHLADEFYFHTWRNQPSINCCCLL